MDNTPRQIIEHTLLASDSLRFLVICNGAIHICPLLQIMLIDEFDPVIFSAIRFPCYGKYFYSVLALHFLR